MVLDMSLTAQRELARPVRLASGLLALVLAISALACAGAALQVLGAQSDTLEAQILGASPTVTVFQYIEAVMTLLCAFGSSEFGCLALSGHFLFRRRSP